MASTPCPFCGAAVPIPDGDTGTCPACQQALRFVDAPEMQCGHCGNGIPLLPGRDAARCGCGHWQAADPHRPLRFEAVCPRCRRVLEVPATEEQHVCPHCQTAMRLQDTF